MALSRESIENIRFDVQKKGYSTDQVDNFLDSVLGEWEAKQKETDKLESDLEHYRSMEKKLAHALLGAEEAAENIVEKAREKAQKIVDEANAYAKGKAEQVEKEENEYRDKSLAEREKYLSQAKLLRDFTEEYKNRIRADLAVFAQKFETVYSFNDKIAENNPKVMEAMAFEVPSAQRMEPDEAAKSPVFDDEDDDVPAFDEPEAAEKDAQQPEAAEAPVQEAPKAEAPKKDELFDFLEENGAPAEVTPKAEPEAAPEKAAEAEKTAEAEKAAPKFDMEQIMQNLPENEDELKAMIDEIL